MSDWSMFHGDPLHTGEVLDSAIDSGTVPGLVLLHSIEVPGSILSTPAIVDGCAFVGLANTQAVASQIGGQLLKIDLASGEPACPPYTWEIPLDEKDSHGFCGMGVTPAVAEGLVVFSAFNGLVYCLRRRKQ